MRISSRITTASIAVCVILVVAGCGAKTADKASKANVTNNLAAGKSAPKTPPQPKAVSTSSITIKVLELGAEPRKKLRYKFKANHTETAVMLTVTDPVSTVSGPSVSHSTVGSASKTSGILSSLASTTPI